MIFISHNKADKDAARNLALFIVAEDAGVWLDEWEIAAGESIIAQIESGLRGCTHFLLLWSERAAKSNCVRRELQSTLMRAIATGKPKVIPVRIDDTPLPELLADLKYVRYGGGAEANRRALIAEIFGRAPSQNFLRAVVKKYQEVIIDQATGEYIGCPSCGSSLIRYQEHDDPESFDRSVVVSCEECDWGTLWA
jgi:hypothetical protein